MPQDKPLPPEILADALQDRIHPVSGRLRAARAVRVEPSSGERPASRHTVKVVAPRDVLRMTAHT